MNLIFITLDGARIDKILKSEILSKVRKSGTSFTNVITYAPYTIAAMHAVFSGEYGFNTGVNSYWATYKFKKNEYKTLTEYLHDNGFRTFGDSINDLVIPAQGFERLNIHDENKDDLTTRHKSLLDEMKELQSKDQKFFLYLHYSNIHTNIMHNVLKKYDNFSEEYFKNKIGNDIKYDEYFKGAESYLDEIITYCKKIGLFDNTLIVIMSDHGISVGEKLGERAYGVFCYDYTIITFALFVNQNFFPETTVTKQVRSIDIMPTILECFKIKQDSKYNQISGKSLTPFLKSYEDERVAIIESGNPLQSGKPPEEPNVIAIRKKKWKYIYNRYNNTKEIYDLTKDPHEEVNLIDKEKILESEMHEELFKIHPPI